MTAISPIRVLRDRRGVVGAYLAATMTAMVVVMVGALDLMRVSIIRSRAQSALDLAVLAAGRNLAAGEKTWKADAAAYFNANMGDSNLGATITGPTSTAVQVVNGANVVQFDATVTVPLMVSAFTQSGSMSFSLSTQARQRSNSNLEMVLAIDTTGSMVDNGKMASAQSAARLAVSTMLGSSTGGVTYMGLVPFNETVNVGNSATTQGWLDTATTPQPLFSGSEWLGCLMERRFGVGGTYQLDDTPPDDTHRFKAYGASRASKNGNSWKTTEYVPKNDKYQEPSSNPNWRGKPQAGCPASRAAFLSANSTDLITRVNGMQAEGSTMIASGLVWSWRMLSPAWRGTAGWGDAKLPQNATTGLNKVVVLLSDGDNNAWASGTSNGYTYFLSPFGNAKYVPYTTKGSVAVWGDLTGPNNTIADRLVWNAMKTTDAGYVASLCDSMKAAGIIIFTIPFGNSISNNTATMLRSCASDSSKYLPAKTDAELQDAYKTVINTLSELTIIQ